MKAFATICVLSLSVIGCALVRSQQDDFGSLHGQVKQTLAASCDCGPIITNPVVGGRYFEVSPLPRGLHITVSERQYLNQNDWERRYSSGTNLMSQFMEMAKTNHPIDAKTVERFAGLTNAFGLFALPEWHYQNIGVDVSVQDVDVVYPGCDQDDAEARKRYQEIIKLLVPYHRPNTY